MFIFPPFYDSFIQDLVCAEQQSTEGLEMLQSIAAADACQAFSRTTSSNPAFLGRGIGAAASYVNVVVEIVTG